MKFVSAKKTPKKTKKKHDFCFDQEKKTWIKWRRNLLHVHPNCVVMKLLNPVILNAWLVMKDIIMETWLLPSFF